MSPRTRRGASVLVPNTSVLVPDPVEQPKDAQRDRLGSRHGLQHSKVISLEPSANVAAGPMSHPAEASPHRNGNARAARALWMPFPEMGQNNDPREIFRSCPSRDYNACFSQELRERYPFTQFNKRHPPLSCYTVGSTLQARAARARSLLRSLHLVGAVRATSICQDIFSETPLLDLQH